LKYHSLTLTTFSIALHERLVHAQRRAASSAMKHPGHPDQHLTTLHRHLSPSQSSIPQSRLRSRAGPHPYREWRYEKVHRGLGLSWDPPTRNGILSRMLEDGLAEHMRPTQPLSLSNLPTTVSIRPRSRLDVCYSRVVFPHPVV
jgi:hypothetical protein